MQFINLLAETGGQVPTTVIMVVLFVVVLFVLNFMFKMARRMLRWIVLLGLSALALLFISSYVL